MIRDLSQTLQTILTQQGLPEELSKAHISFDRPTDKFKPQQTTIDLFLFEIQENKELRDNEIVIEQRNGAAVIHQPLRRLACSYLVTAWPVTGSDLELQEHRLLSQVFQLLSCYPIIPAPFLHGSLQEQVVEYRRRGQEPILPPMVVSTADGLRSTAEFWTALNSPLRTSLVVTATLSMEVPPTPEPAHIDITHEAAIAITHEFRPYLEPERPDWYTPSAFYIAGQVIDGNNRAIAHAQISFLETHLTTTTDIQGHYKLGPLLPQTAAYTVQISVADATPQTFPITVPAIKGGSYNIRLT